MEEYELIQNFHPSCYFELRIFKIPKVQLDLGSGTVQWGAKVLRMATVLSAALLTIFEALPDELES
jgi:hypothetical protein